MISIPIFVSNINDSSQFFISLFAIDPSVVLGSSTFRIIPISCSDNLILYNQDTSSLLQPIFLTVQDIETISTKAIDLGSCLVEDRTINGQIFRKFQTPVQIELILIQDGCKTSMSEQIFDWIHSPPIIDSAPTTEPPLSPIETTPRWNPTIGKYIPTLFPELLDQNSFKSITPNSPEPIPFETELFKGEVLLMIMTPDQEDFYHQRFLGTKYLLEVQVQGQFLCVPEGHLYFGGEITKKMELGLLTRGMSSTILQLGRAVNQYMHHSFGDKANRELPHVSGPLWSAVDRLVITPQGEVPPQMGIPVVEPEPQRTQRRKDPQWSTDINLTSTYTFTFKSSNIDLVGWKCVNIPLMKPFDLRNFWSDSDLTLLAYSIPVCHNPAEASGQLNGRPLPKLHLAKEKKLWFAISLKHKINHPELEGQLPIGLEGGLTRCQVLEWNKGRLRFRSEALMSPTREKRRKSICSDKHRSSSSESFPFDEDQFFDAPEGPENDDEEEEEEDGNREGSLGLQGTQIIGNSYGDFGDSSGSEDEKEDEKEEKEEEEEDSNTSRGLIFSRPIKIPTKEEAEVIEGIEYDEKQLSESSQLASSLDSSSLSFKGEGRVVNVSNPALCPTRDLVSIVIEVDDRRKGSLTRHAKTRRTLYAFSVLPKFHPKESSASSANEFVLRSYMEFQDLFPSSVVGKVSHFKKPANYSRCSEGEQRRLELDHLYRIMLLQSRTPDSAARSKLAKFLISAPHTDDFLSPHSQGVGASKLRSDIPGLVKHSLACTQLSNSHWSEECLVLTSNDLVFIKPHKNFSPVRLVVSISSIFAARAVPESEFPIRIGDSSVLLVSTFSRQYMVMVRGRELRDEWVSEINSAVHQSKMGYPKTPINSVVSPGFLSRTFSIAASNPLPDLKEELRLEDLDGDIFQSFSHKPHLNLLVRPKGWKLGEKLILNARTFTRRLSVTSSTFLCPEGMASSEDWPTLLRQPVLLLERLLSLALRLSSLINPSTSLDSQTQSFSPRRNYLPRKGEQKRVLDLENDNTQDSLSPEVESIWISFMDGVSLLQAVDPSLLIEDNSLCLPHEDRVCLFLNLYHTLYLHAAIVMGAPATGLKWKDFFPTCAYEAFGDVFSMADLEHCIIRNAMSRPSIPLAQVFIPSSHFPFALRSRDPRLIWAVNCGSQSLLPEVPIFTVDSLSSQLDEVVRRSLELQVEIFEGERGSGGIIVHLPQTCQWYSKDLEGEEDLSSPSASAPLSSNPSSTRTILTFVCRHMRGEQEALLARALSNRKLAVNIKYTPFNYKCRFLQLLEDDS